MGGTENAIKIISLGFHGTEKAIKTKTLSFCDAVRINGVFMAGQNFKVLKKP